MSVTKYKANVASAAMHVVQCCCVNKCIHLNISGDLLLLQCTDSVPETFISTGLA